jgi:hypothetical protein
VEGDFVLTTTESIGREFPITDEIKNLGFSKVCTIGKTLFIYNAKVEPIHCQYYKDDLPKTMNKLKKALSDSHEFDNIKIEKFIVHLSQVWVKIVEEEQDSYKIEKDNHRSQRSYTIQKYTTDIPAVAEAVLVNGQPLFLQVINGKAVLSESMTLPGEITLNPPDKVAYLSKEYSFQSEDEINNYTGRAKNENLDSLFYKVKAIWAKYIDAEDYHIVICAADTIFTYFQDKLGMTHYLLFVGDNNVGKTNNLIVFQYLGYRPLFDTSITPANIYQFLGSMEEGQGIILEDETDHIEQLEEKMKIYKVGYKTGAKVSRMDTSSGRNQQSYWTYGFKAFTAEQQPDSHKGKGFNERIFVIKCSIGNPEYDISEVISPAGDEKYHLLLDELLDMRKLLLIYRLLHHRHPIPDVSLNIMNRDKQLSKPLIRLFQGTKCVNEILGSLSKFLAEKKERKGNTLEARLYRIVEDLADLGAQGSLSDNDTIILESKLIWDTIKEKIDGDNIQGKPQSYETAEYGPISQKKIASILEDRFEGEHTRDEKVRKLKFSRKKLKRLGTNYSFINKIEIIREGSNRAEEDSDKNHNDLIESSMQPTNTNDASDTSTDNQTPSENVWNTETGNNTSIISENKNDNLENNENITIQTALKDPLYSVNVSDASDVSGVDKNQNTDSNGRPLNSLPSSFECWHRDPFKSEPFDLVDKA